MLVSPLGQVLCEAKTPALARPLGPVMCEAKAPVLARPLGPVVCWAKTPVIAKLQRLRPTQETLPLSSTRGESAPDSEEEMASSDDVAKGVERIMHFVSNVYATDDSKMTKKDDKPFILPPWATGDRSEHRQMRLLRADL